MSNNRKIKVKFRNRTKKLMLEQYMSSIYDANEKDGIFTVFIPITSGNEIIDVECATYSSKAFNEYFEEIANENDLSGREED